MAQFQRHLNLTLPDRFKVEVGFLMHDRKRVEETQRWLKSPDLPGCYTIRDRRVDTVGASGAIERRAVLDYWFSQERTAMLFKLRFG